MALLRPAGRRRRRSVVRPFPYLPGSAIVNDRAEAIEKARECIALVSLICSIERAWFE